MEPGTRSPEWSCSRTSARGFYITDLIGSGNMVTGDYSRGASGFWIDKGEKAYPVSEVTIAGNLRDIFRNVTPARTWNSDTAPTRRPYVSRA